MKGEILNTKVEAGDKELRFSKIYTDSISQNGINGADYLIVVPDSAAEKMAPYYTNLAASVINAPDNKLRDKLDDIRQKKNGIMPEKNFRN